MKAYSVEGLVIIKSSRGKSGAPHPYSHTFWANSSAEALQMALESNPGARWVEGPEVSGTTEEQRMRALGAPELPGMESLPAPKKAPARPAKGRRA